MLRKNRKPRIENVEIINKKDNKKTKKKHRILKVLLIIIVIFLILGMAIFSAYLIKSKGNIKEAALGIVTDFVGEQEPIFVLLLGVSEDISTALTDTIMLAGYNPQTQNAFVVSIPRDTYVGKNTVSANGYDKINARYQLGYEKTIAAVEELTGIKIDYYVLIKNNALVDVVDSIGGVEFNVPINMNYDDVTQNLHIHLKSGLQTLNGEQAEQLVRFRHNNDGSSYPSSYGDNDYGRMRTQREFIKTFAKQLIRLDNVPRVKEIATAIFNNLETDITLSKVIAYVPFGLKLDIENNLKMIQLPGQSDLINELWFYVPNYEKIGELFDELIAELKLEDSVKQSHYKRIKKSNIKIEKVNKSKDKENVKNINQLKNEILEQPIKNNSIENNLIKDNNNKIVNDNIQNSNDNKLNDRNEESTNNIITNSSINNTVTNDEKDIVNTQNSVKNESDDNSNTNIETTVKPSTEENRNKDTIKDNIKENKIESTNIEISQNENT